MDGSEVHKVCKASSPAIRLGCGDSPKKYQIRYSTKDASIGVNFMVSFQGTLMQPVAGSHLETAVSILDVFIATLLVNFINNVF